MRRTILIVFHNTDRLWSIRTVYPSLQARMKAIQSRLGRRMRALRSERGWTQEELASRAKKHPTYIGGIERGERNPTLTVLADVARAFGISLAALMEEDRG